MIHPQWIAHGAQCEYINWVQWIAHGAHCEYITWVLYDFDIILTTKGKDRLMAWLFIFWVCITLGIRILLDFCPGMRLERGKEE